MAVARKPAGKPASDTEAAAERFITGAVRAVPPPTPTRKTPVMMRFDAGLLARVDKAAKRRGISPLGLDCLHRVGGAGQRGQQGMSTASFARIKAAAQGAPNEAPCRPSQPAEARIAPPPVAPPASVGRLTPLQLLGWFAVDCCNISHIKMMTIASSILLNQKLLKTFWSEKPSSSAEL